MPKSCGVFVTNSSTYLQQIPLGGDYSAMTSGTFTWLIDVPAGLSLEVQMCKMLLSSGVQLRERAKPPS